jgi:hypothetical protein
MNQQPANQSINDSINHSAPFNPESQVTSNYLPALCRNLRSGMRAIFATYGWSENTQYYLSDASPCPTRQLPSGRLQVRMAVIHGHVS